MEKIEFSLEDVLDKFDHILVLPPETRERVMSFLNHEIHGAYGNITTNVYMFENILADNLKDWQSKKPYVQAKRLERRIKLATEEHDNLIKLNREMIELNTLLETQKNSPKTKKYLETTSNEVLPLAIKEKSQSVLQSLKSTINEYNIFSRDIFSSELLESKDDIAYSITNVISIMNEHYARSADTEKNKYYFKNEIRKKYVDQLMINGKNTPKMEEPNLHSIEAAYPYTSNVFNVLRQNAQDHAYDRRNDKYNRLSDPAFVRTIKIKSQPDTKNKQTIIHFEDNGFGIPKGKDIFEKGVSSKTDNRNHGLGLWAAKEFVVEHGGKIDYDAQPGEGTIFYFTIPYDRIEHGCVYVQDSKSRNTL